MTPQKAGGQMKKYLQRIKNAWRVLTGYIPPEIANLTDKQVRDITNYLSGYCYVARMPPKGAQRAKRTAKENLPGVEE